MVDNLLNHITLISLTEYQWPFILLIFVWSGFVRTGIGFGGAALGLPLLLLVDPRPVIYIPIIGIHLLFFSSLTLKKRINNVNWPVAKKTIITLLPAKIVGVLGLIHFPDALLATIVFIACTVYALQWIFPRLSQSSIDRPWLDFGLLNLGGYISGTSLIGAPIIAAIVGKQTDKTQLRETLFIIWMILVTIKLISLTAFGIALNWQTAIVLMPVAFIGHLIGLKFHDYLLLNDTQRFHQFIGVSLLVVSIAGLWQTFF